MHEWLKKKQVIELKPSQVDYHVVQVQRERNSGKIYG